MNDISLDEIKGFIEYAKSATTSAHPYLDGRWEREPKARRPYYRFCQALSKWLKPKLIVELGIDEGDCCGHWAHGSPGTQVLGVDVHKDGEYPSERCRDVEKQFSNFKYLRGWTWDRVGDVAKHGKIDILMIDSWHEPDYLIKDWVDYAPLLADTNIVIIDDLQIGGLGNVLEAIPSKFTYIDRTMNPACPYGIAVNADKAFTLPYAKRQYMP
jgi:hypothetical protein